MFRKLYIFLVLLGIVSISLLFSWRIILTEAGRYLAPEGVEKADVVILEGGELVRENAVRIGLKLLSSGRGERLVVLYHHSEDEQIFGRPSTYSFLLTKRLEDLGLRKDQIQVLAVPIDHPVTLTEAQIVLSSLSSKYLQIEYFYS